MTISEELVIARFVHFLALSVLFGGALFPFYGLGPTATDSYKSLRWLRTLLIGAAAFTLASGFYWFANAVLYADAGSLPATIGDKNFEAIWLFRLLLATALVFLTLGRRALDRRLLAVGSGALILLASIALTGNAGSNAGSTAFQHRLADAVHLVASGVWIGALVVFSRLITMSVRHGCENDLRVIHDALARFARVGTIAVACLTLSGMINPGFFRSSLDSVYGQVLLAKLVVFVMMLTLAGANRFWLTPRLAAALNSGGDLKVSITALRASIVIETALGVVVLALVSWLGVLPPPSFE